MGFTPLTNYPPQPIDYCSELNVAAKKAERLGAKSAQNRLDWLVREIQGKRPESLNALASSDLYSLVDVNGIIEGIKVKHDTPRLLNILEGLRNVLVLFPLVFTWYEISQAVMAYQRFLDANPADYNVPILYLWQTSFNHTLSGFFVLSLGTLAIIDAGLLLLLVFFTFFISWQTHIINNRKDEQAEELRADLADALAHTSFALATSPSNPQQPINLVGHFDRITKELLQQIEDEHKLLRDTINQGQQNLIELTKGLTLASGDMNQSSGALRQATGNLDTTSKTFATTNQALEKTNQALLDTSNGLNTSVSGLGQSIQTLNGTQQKLVDAAAGIITGLTNMVAKQEAMLTQQTALISRQEAAVSGLETLRNTIDHSLANLKQDVGDLALKADGVIKSLGTAGTAVNDLILEIKTLNVQQQQYVSALGVLQRDQQVLVTNMASLTGNMLNDMKAIDQYMQALPNTIQGIWTEAGKAVDRMGTIPNVFQGRMDPILRAYEGAAGELRNASQELRTVAGKLKP